MPEFIAPSKITNSKGVSVCIFTLDKKSVVNRVMPAKTATQHSVQALTNTGLMVLRCLPVIFTLKPYIKADRTTNKAYGLLKDRPSLLAERIRTILPTKPRISPITCQRLIIY